jgi:hypothetical protein
MTFYDAPLDVKPGWLNVARRAQSVAKSAGHSIITLRVVVNADGEALAWAEPERVKLEPCRLANILSLLTGGGSGSTI